MAVAPTHTHDSEAQTKLLTVTLTYDREGGQTLSPPKRHTLAITDGLARLLARAAVVRPTSNQTPLSFSSLAVAMLADEDAWLRNYLIEQDANVSAIEARMDSGYDTRRLAANDAQDLKSEYPTSESARAALEHAEKIAHALGKGPVDVRHLCAAYPALDAWHVEDFTEFRIDRLAWCRAFGAVMAERFPSEKWYWRAYADRASPVPQPAFSADVYTKEDLIGIDRSVDALAMVIASTRTTTPLALGFFGPWGSGKSFFMRSLRDRVYDLRSRERPRIAGWVEKRAQKKAKAADAPLYFDQIAQVDFNAWHYNEGNLVASLVEHLFRNLRVLPEDEEDEELETRRTQALLQLNGLKDQLADGDAAVVEAKGTLDQAKQQVARASDAAESARQEVDDKAREIERLHADFESKRKHLDDELARATDRDRVDVGAVIDVALGPFAPLIADVRAAATEAKKTAFDWGAFFSRVGSAKGLLVLAVVVTGPMLAFAASWAHAEWTALFSGAAAALAGLGTAFETLVEGRRKIRTPAECARNGAASARRRREVEARRRAGRARGTGRKLEGGDRGEAQAAVGRARGAGGGGRAGGARARRTDAGLRREGQGACRARSQGAAGPAGIREALERAAAREFHQGPRRYR